jgi:hypothetical protein
MSFGDIPSTYDDLFLCVSVRTDRAYSSDGIKLRFNGASNDANLSYREIQGNGSSAYSQSSTTFFQSGIASGSTATSNTFGSNEIYIPNYAGSTNKSISGFGCSETNGTEAYLTAFAGLWSNTNAITSITILPLIGSNFSANSSAFLYGIKKA